MKEQFIDHNFSLEGQRIIKKANDILDEYAAMGYDLSLRQLYYQFISTDTLPEQQQKNILLKIAKDMKAKK